jgi:hypothetical protein
LVFFVREKDPPKSQSLKLIWDVYMRMPVDYPNRQIYDVVNLTLTALGEQGCCNVKNPEGQSCEVMWIVDLRILDHSIMGTLEQKLRTINL